ncbi:formate/nitrite transporter family protein [Arthrobacter sp. NPDC089319]|uniref:formate/nitrite transporter family protein n=1 Tax=Arthrobacter sp. NPDC089319 TaxID=3155915 RepID=UPI00343EE0DD
MSYIKPTDVVNGMVAAGAAKAGAGTGQLLIRGVLGGAILACATTLALNASVQMNGIVAAIVFPLGFVMIVLLGLELVTGSFALIPLAVHRKQASMGDLARNFAVVITGHLIGCIGYATAYAAVVTRMGTSDADPMIQMLVNLAEAKTVAYAGLGASGMLLVFLKAVLCNWMVTLGVVMAMTSTSTGGKIAAMWLPVTCFFGQGFEHAVVNMFVIPAGMMLGADVSIGDWWLWNQGPVLLGNFAGGLLMTGVGLYLAHRTAPSGKSGRAERESLDQELRSLTSSSQDI